MAAPKCIIGKRKLKHKNRKPVSRWTIYRVMAVMYKLDVGIANEHDHYAAGGFARNCHMWQCQDCGYIGRSPG